MHPFSTTRLVFGLLYLGVAGLWLADRVGWVSDSSYFVPILLILVGGIGLVAFALCGVTRRRQAGDVVESHLETTDLDEATTAPITTHPTTTTTTEETPR